MLKMCLCFSQRHLDLFLARHGHPVLSPQDRALPWREKQGARKESRIDVVCISLASSGDVNIGKVER